MAETTDILNTTESTLRLDPICDLAIQGGIIDSQQAAELQEEHERTAKPVRNLIVDTGYITEDDLLAMMAGYMGCEVISLPDTEISPEVRSAVPAAVARMYNVIPVDMTPGSVTLATSIGEVPQVAGSKSAVRRRFTPS